MREPDFEEFRRDLLHRGIVPAIAERTCRELEEHYEDLVAELEAGGAASDAARGRAIDALGKLDDIAVAMSGRRELKTWPYRHPYAALVVYPLACIAALPAVPVIAGVSSATQLARWGASLLAAGAFTAGLLLLLQLSILFG